MVLEYLLQSAHTLTRTFNTYGKITTEMQNEYLLFITKQNCVFKSFVSNLMGLPNFV